MAIEHFMTLSTTEPNNNVGNLKIRKDDDETQTLKVSVTSNSTPTNLNGYKAFFILKTVRTTGIVEQEAKIINATGGKVDYTLNGYDWQHVGENTAYFSFRKLTSDNNWKEQFTTRDFVFKVTQNAFSSGITDSNYIWTFEDLLRLVNEYITTGKSDWEEFVEQNKEMLESIDPGGKILSELINARTNPNGETFANLKDRLDHSDYLLFQLWLSESQLEIKGDNIRFLTSLESVENTYMQSFAIDLSTDEIYMAQADSVTGNYKSFYLARLTPSGKVLDKMYCLGAGHGTSFGIEKDGDKTYIWSNYQVYAEGMTGIYEYRLGRFVYVPGGSLNISDVEFFDHFTANQYTFPYIDQVHGYLLTRTRNGLGGNPHTEDYAELRKLEDVKNGIDELLFKVTIPNDEFGEISKWLQGFCSDKTTLYWYLGMNNAETRISSYDMTTGSLISTEAINFGKEDSLNGHRDNNYEAEGLFFYTDTTGQRALLLGLSTGGLLKREQRVYMISQRGAIPLIDNKTKDKVTINGPGNSLKYVPLGASTLGSISDIGMYYISTADSTKLLDHPEPGVAGWFFENYPKLADGSRIQKLTRNSQSLSLTYVRVIPSTGGGEWITSGDKPWVDVPFNTGYVLNSGYGLQYRLIGLTKVEYRFTVKKSTGGNFDNTGNPESIAVFPSAIKPKYSHFGASRGQGGKTGDLAILASGELQVGSRELSSPSTWFGYVGAYYLN